LVGSLAFDVGHCGQPREKIALASCYQVYLRLEVACAKNLSCSRYHWCFESPCLLFPSQTPQEPQIPRVSWMTRWSRYPVVVVVVVVAYNKLERFSVAARSLISYHSPLALSQVFGDIAS